MAWHAHCILPSLRAWGLNIEINSQTNILAREKSKCYLPNPKFIDGRLQQHGCNWFRFAETGFRTNFIANGHISKCMLMLTLSFKSLFVRMHQIGRYHGEWKRRKRKWRFNVRGICKNLAPELGHRMRCPLCWHVIFSLIPNFIPKIISIWDEPRVFYFRFYLPFESGRREHLIISIWDEPRVFFILGGIELLKEFCWLYENAHFIRDRSDSEKHNHSESQSDEWVRRYEWQTYDTLV